MRSSRAEHSNIVGMTLNLSEPSRPSKNETWQKTVDEFQQTYVQQHPPTRQLKKVRLGDRDDSVEVKNDRPANIGTTREDSKVVSRETERKQQTPSRPKSDSRTLENQRHRQNSAERLERASIEEMDDEFDNLDNRSRFSPTSKMIADSYNMNRRQSRKETVGDRAANFVDDIFEGVRGMFSPTAQRRSRSLSRMNVTPTKDTETLSTKCDVKGRRSSSSSRDMSRPGNTSVVNIYQEHLTEKVRSPRSKRVKTLSRNHSGGNTTKGRCDTPRSLYAKDTPSNDATVQFNHIDICDEDDDILCKSDDGMLEADSAGSARRDIGVAHAATGNDIRYYVSGDDDDLRYNYTSFNNDDDALLRIRPVPLSGSSRRSCRYVEPRHSTLDINQNIPDHVNKGVRVKTSVNNGPSSTSVFVSHEHACRQPPRASRNDIGQERSAPEQLLVNAGSIAAYRCDSTDNDVTPTQIANYNGTIQKGVGNCHCVTERMQYTDEPGKYSVVVMVPDDTRISSKIADTFHTVTEIEPRSSFTILTGPGASCDTPIVNPVRAETVSIRCNAPTIPPRINRQPVRNSVTDVVTSPGGTFSNQPLIIADLSRLSDTPGSVQVHPGYVVAESRSGNMYGTRPYLHMNKSQMLNMYVFNKSNATAESAVRNHDNSTERNRGTTSDGTASRKVAFHHRRTQTPSTTEKHALLEQQRLSLTSRPYTTGPIDPIDNGYEEMYNQGNEYVRYVDTCSNTPQWSPMNTATERNITETRQLVCSSNTIAPQADACRNIDIITHAADAAVSNGEVTTMALSDEESANEETETVTTEVKESKIVITLSEEIEFNTTRTPGGRTLLGGEHGMDIEQWWLPDK